MTMLPEEKEDKWFRVSVCLERFFSDERARCFVGVSGARHVRWLSRRLRRLFPALPRRLALLTQGHLLPSDEPLALLRPDDVVQVVPIPADFNQEDVINIISESRQTALNTDPPPPKRKKLSLSFHKKKKTCYDLENNLSNEINHATLQPQIGLTENTTTGSIQNKIVVKCSQSEIKECALERETSPHQHTGPVQQRKKKINSDQNNEKRSMLDKYFGNEIGHATPLDEISLREHETDTSTLSANNLVVEEPLHVDLLKEVKERALALLDNAVAIRRRRRVRRRRRPSPGFIPEPLIKCTVTNVDEPSNDNPIQVSDQETPSQPAESLPITEPEPESEGEFEHNSANVYEVSKNSSHDSDINLHNTSTIEESGAPALVNSSNVALPVAYRWAAGAPAVVRNAAASRRPARQVRPLETGVETLRGNLVQLLPSVLQITEIVTATSLPA